MDEQRAEALGYVNPRKSIKQIHLRHKDRLDKLSRRVPIDTPLGGKQVLVYIRPKGFTKSVAGLNSPWLMVSMILFMRF